MCIWIIITIQLWQKKSNYLIDLLDDQKISKLSLLLENDVLNIKVNPKFFIAVHNHNELGTTKNISLLHEDSS